MAGRTAMAGCTIVARNYIPYARVLADGWRRHHPRVPLHVLVIDEDDGDARDEGVRVRAPAELGVPPAELARLRGIYGVAELTTALKPALLRRLLDEGAEVAVFLDSDTDVRAGLHGIVPLAERHGIVLSPHYLLPPPLDGRTPGELDKLRSGIFNSGFLAVGRAGTAFLDWWASRLRRDCLFSDPTCLHADQGWLSFVPAYFEHHVLRDPGVNVGPWNVHERRIRYDGDAPTVCGGAPLRTFHFAGLEPERTRRGPPGEWPFSRYHEPLPGRPPPLRADISREPGLDRLCREYVERLLAAGLRQLGRIPYRYAVSAGGRPLGPWERRAYRELLLAAEARGLDLPDPFDPAGARAVERMLDAPRAAGLLSDAALARLCDARLSRPVDGPRWRDAHRLARQLVRRAPGRRHPWTPHALPSDRILLEYAGGT